MTKTIFQIENDWNDKTLSAALTWVNDGRDPMFTEQEAHERHDAYIAINPDDLGRISISSHEVEV